MEKVVVPPVVTLLTESPTETLLCIRGRCVAVDAKEVKQWSRPMWRTKRRWIEKEQPGQVRHETRADAQCTLKDRGSRGRRRPRQHRRAREPRAMIYKVYAPKPLPRRSGVSFSQAGHGV